MLAPQIIENLREEIICILIINTPEKLALNRFVYVFYVEQSI